MIQSQIERNFYVEIKHIASKKTLWFKGWLDNFSDNFKVNWKTEDIYGRMDPVKTYGSTGRNISLTFKAIASSEQEAINNLAKIEVLAAMMYPTFNKKKGGNIQSGPVLQVKFANLLVNPPHKESSAHMREELSSEIGGPPPGDGLYCVANGFSYNPTENKEQGYYMANGAIYPMMVKIKLELAVIHDKPLGWYSSQKGTGVLGGEGNAVWRGSKKFPYGLGGLSQEVVGVSTNDSNNKVVVGVKQARVASIMGQVPDDAGSGAFGDWGVDLK